MAFARAVVVKSAGTGVHGGGQHEARGEGQRHGSPRDANSTVFERLAHDLQNVAREFGEFIEKQNAIMSERNFARPRDGAAANETRVRDGVMRRAERAQPDQSGARVEHARHAVNLGGLKRFFKCKRRQDGRHAFRQHRFSRSWRPDHQNVVAAGACDFEGALGGLLAANVFEIHMELLRLAEQLIGIDLQPINAVAGIDVMNDVKQRLDGIHFNAPDHGRFASVDLGHDHALHLRPTGLDRDRQRAAYSAQAAVERKLADKERVGDLLLIQTAVCSENAESHGQIKAGTLLTDVGRGQINGDLGGWDVIAAVFQRRADPVAAFADSSIGQADSMKVVFRHFDARDIHFHFDNVGVNTVNGGAQGFIKHRNSSGHTKGRTRMGDSCRHHSRCETAPM